MHRRDFFLRGAAAATLVTGTASLARADEDEAFEGFMGQANRAFRGLRRAASEPGQSKDALAAVQALQAALVGAKGTFETVPMSPQATERYGDRKEEYHRDFRLKLVQTLAETLALEKALLEGQVDKANASLQRIRELQKDGHGLFQERRER